MMVNVAGRAGVALAIGIMISFAPTVGAAKGAARKTVSAQMEFIHLGLLHNYHFDSSYHYPPSALLALVGKVKPDLICGEAEAGKWDAGLAGIYPFENRILEFAGRKSKAKFAPVDWRTSYAEVSALMDVVKKHVTSEALDSGRKERDRLDEEFEKAFTSRAGPRFAQYLHDEFWADAARYHTLGERFFGDIPNGFWYRRNTNIAVNCYEAAKKSGATRILVAYGAEHQYLLDALLRYLPNARSRKLGEVIQWRAIDMSSQKLPEELKAVFTSDLQALEAYVSQLPPESAERKELSEKRIPGLKKVMDGLFP